MKKILFLALATGALLTSCKKDDDNKSGIFKGPEVQVHDGKAWSWLELGKDGKPVRLAVTITDKALNSVPVGDGDMNHDHSDMENNWIVKFNPRANGVIPFNHLGMGWNPNGHEPEMIYGLPHFDFHFYMQTPEEVAAIPPYDVAPAKFDNWPAPNYLPLMYHNFGGGVPQMGTHWLDVTSPELSGATFTQTFIYGSYDGKVTFYEPMITLDFLKNTSVYERPVPQPAKVQQTGYYPTKMRIVKHDGVTEIILDEFLYRTQS